MGGSVIAKAVKTIPRFVVDYNSTPYAADNIWQAQMSGWERVLSYRPLTRPEGRAVRGNTMAFHHEENNYRIPILTGLDRDEYPFASTCEGSHLDVGTRSVFVGHIPAAENRSVGGRLGHFLKRHEISQGMCFEVEVINHPNGAVKVGTVQTGASSKRMAPADVP